VFLSVFVHTLSLFFEIIVRGTLRGTEAKRPYLRGRVNVGTTSVNCKLVGCIVPGTHTPHTYPLILIIVVGTQSPPCLYLQVSRLPYESVCFLFFTPLAFEESLNIILLQYY
jgi:hypothetical protein